jgi:hypothetical protein
VHYSTFGTGVRIFPPRYLSPSNAGWESVQRRQKCYTLPFSNREHGARRAGGARTGKVGLAGAVSDQELESVVRLATELKDKHYNVATELPS